MVSPKANGQFVQVNDLNVYYEEYGSGAPLVLVHAALVSSASWQASIPSFSEHFRVIALDSRAHGRTNNPKASLSYAMMADDTAAFIQALGLEKPSVAGWSDGGQIVLELGMRYPDLANALVVGGAWYKLTDAYRGMVKSIGFEGVGQLNEAVFEQFLVQSGAGPEMEAMHHHGADYLKTLAKQLSTPFLTDLNYSVSDFQKITAPTLIMQGDRDELIQLEQAVEMYRQISKAELSIAANVGHGFPLSHTSLFNATILEFLLRHKN